jgi:hypothetical protein
MENYKKIIQVIQETLEEGTSAGIQFIPGSNQCLFPIYWGEDNNGNIMFDVDSMRDDFDCLIEELEKHNEITEFEF